MNLTQNKNWRKHHKVLHHHRQQNPTHHKRLSPPGVDVSEPEDSAYKDHDDPADTPDEDEKVPYLSKVSVDEASEVLEGALRYSLDFQ